MNIHKLAQKTSSTSPAIHCNEKERLHIHSVLNSGIEQPLDTNTRAFMEPRFAYDFSRVRIHTDERAVKSAQAVNALAYTIGQHIVFGAGQYAPNSSTGKKLLAHELSHVVQQQSTPIAPQGKLGVKSPSNKTERTADEAARSVMRAENNPDPSLARQIRHHLLRSSLPSPTLQRAVTTWGGEFVDDTYELQREPGIDGVHMHLRFVPNEYVDAERIGMTQTASSVHQGKPLHPGFLRHLDDKQPGFDPARSDNTFRSRRILLHQGETGPHTGTMIDQVPSRANPLFAAYSDRPPFTLAEAPMFVPMGEPGYRYREDGQLKQADAKLNDNPGLPSTLGGKPITETSQIFETTALAVKGVQAGTYYGSVLWGWIKDAGGKLKKLPLTRVSNDRPSRMFTHASLAWNQSTTMTGQKNISLPVVSRQYTRALTRLVDNPSEPWTTFIAQLKENTRVQVQDTVYGHLEQPDKWWKVTVLDKAHKGKVGWVIEKDLKPE